MNVIMKGFVVAGNRVFVVSVVVVVDGVIVFRFLLFFFDFRKAFLR